MTTDSHSAAPEWLLATLIRRLLAAVGITACDAFRTILAWFGAGDLFVGRGLCQEHSMDLEYIYNQPNGVTHSVVLLGQDPQAPGNREEKLDINAADSKGSSSTVRPCVKSDFILLTSMATVC